MDSELYNAAIDGSESFFEKIKDVDLNLQLTSQGNSLLHVAAKTGKKKIVEEILNSQPSLMYMTNSEGNTPLHIAASLGHLEMTQLLINRTKLQEVEEQNELLRMENVEKEMPMHGAVRNGHYEIVDILIREDHSLVSSTNSAGESPLFLAVDRGFYKIALHILKIVPKCSYEGRNKMNVLHVVAIRTLKCKQFREEKVPYASKALTLLNQLLLKSSYLKFGSTSKISVTCADFVRELLNNCPSALLEKDEFGWIPLHHAAHAGNAKVVELFLENNHQLACIITDKEGMSALHISAKEGHVDVMKTLITKCPEICELLDSRGRTALHVAVESREVRAVKVLLETVAFQDLINKQDTEGNTPLHLAAVKGFFSLLENTSLHLADVKGFFSVLEMLAQNRKVDKGATNKKGMTAIDIVSSKEDIDTGKEASKILKRMGSRLSLQQGVTREANRSVMKDEAETTYQENESKHESFNGYVSQRIKDMAETKHHQENAKEKEDQRIKEMANFNLLIATIIATVTFAAGIALPGGYNTSIDSLQTLSRNSTSSLPSFVVSNSLAFGCSSTSMFLHFLLSLLPGVFRPLYPKQFAKFLTECAILGMMVAFMVGTFVVFPEDSRLAHLVLVITILSLSSQLLVYYFKYSFLLKYCVF